MIRIILAALAAGVLTSAPACSQPTTPTTKILAIGALASSADPKTAAAILPAEVRATVDLYLDGKIDQWYSLEDRRGVLFILNMTDIEAARATLEKLPLGRAHLMTFTLTPIGPLNPLRRLRDADPVR